MATGKRNDCPILGESFIALHRLWEEDAEGGALFPSETAARWFLKANKGALSEAQAIAFHRGRIFVHRKRIEEVAQKLALDAARRRAA